MKLEQLKNIDQATDRDMLNYIFATQLQLMRRLDFIELSISKLNGEETNGEEIVSHFDTTNEMIRKVDPFIERINEFLSADDIAKGILRF